MDFGFHAPTLSFPVAGTLMIEPTESESLAEIDKFCDAMIAIKQEINKITDGSYEYEQSMLRNAPHTAEHAISSHWDLPYTREEAVYPLISAKDEKFSEIEAFFSSPAFGAVISFSLFWLYANLIELYPSTSRFFT